MTNHLNKLFYILSKLTGVLIFVLMGFTAFSVGNININGWHTIDFKLSTAMTFASIFVLLMIIVAVLLILMGYVCQFALTDSTDKDSFAFVCKKLNEKYRFANWGRWLFLTEFILSIAYIICITIYVNQLNNTYWDGRAIIMMMPYLLMIFSGIFSYFIFIHPIIKKHENRDAQHTNNSLKNNQNKKTAKNNKILNKNTKKSDTKKTR